MAEAVVSETPEIVTEAETADAQDMEVEAPEPPQSNESGSADNLTNGDNSNSKRAREEAGEEEDAEDDASGKKQKVEKSVEEERLEKLEDAAEPGPFTLGPKTFGSSVDMFDYFYMLMHNWPPNLDVNKYEHLVMVDLLKKGHTEADKKIGVGIHSFQVRNHPEYKSRCFFIIRDDQSVDDFSFRKCVDHISPLPEDMKVNTAFNKALGGGHGGRGGGRGRGRGRGGRGGFRGRY